MATQHGADPPRPPAVTVTVSGSQLQAELGRTLARKIGRLNIGRQSISCTRCLEMWFWSPGPMLATVLDAMQHECREIRLAAVPRDPHAEPAAPAAMPPPPVDVDDVLDPDADQFPDPGFRPDLLADDDLGYDRALGYSTLPL